MPSQQHSPTWAHAARMKAAASQHQIREVTRIRKRQLVAQLQQAQRMQLHVTLGVPSHVISAAQPMVRYFLQRGLTKSCFRALLGCSSRIKTAPDKEQTQPQSCPEIKANLATVGK